MSTVQFGDGYYGCNLSLLELGLSLPDAIVVMYTSGKRGTGMGRQRPANLRVRK